MDKCELKVTVLIPLSHSAVCKLLWFFGDYHTLQGETKILGLFEWSSSGNTAAFNHRIVNTSVGAPLTDTACLDALDCA